MPPTLPIPTIESTPEEFENYNREAGRIYSGEMAKCIGCGRTFADAEKLAAHQTSCSAYKEYLEARRRCVCPAMLDVLRIRSTCVGLARNKTGYVVWRVRDGELALTVLLL